MSAPFEALAADYDESFTSTPIGQLMRRAVWRRCDTHFAAGTRVLEMNCGTGEDAVHLASRGVRVFATDAAPAMVARTIAKVEHARVHDRVSVQQLDWCRLESLEAGDFDGALSNFGGLNCLGRVDAVRRPLAARLRPGAVLLVCVMGPMVPWEWLWFLLRAQPGNAFRRLRRGGTCWRGIRIRYPSIRALRRSLAPEFRMLRVAAVGALLPPPYADVWIRRRPGWLARLNRWERRFETVPPLPWLADHYLMELQRV